MAAPGTGKGQVRRSVSDAEEDGVLSQSGPAGNHAADRRQTNHHHEEAQKQYDPENFMEQMSMMAAKVFALITCHTHVHVQMYTHKCKCIHADREPGTTTEFSWSKGV